MGSKIGMIWILVGIWLAAPITQAAEARVGQSAPNFFVQTYNPKLCGSRRVFLDQMIGEEATKPKKLLILTFFNIDCKPCRKELPFLQNLYNRYRDNGLMVLAVNCDNVPKKIQELEHFIEQAGFTFPVLKDRFQALRRRYGVSAYPTMFMVDTDGKILDIRVGYDVEKKPFPLKWVKQKLGVDHTGRQPEGTASKSSKK